MRKRITLGFAISMLSSVALAQESPAPTPAPTSEQSPSVSMSPEQSVSSSTTPEQTPSVSPARSVRINFVPPPMDGTITLGIYDESDKMVRILRRNAPLNDF